MPTESIKEASNIWAITEAVKGEDFYFVAPLPCEIKTLSERQIRNIIENTFTTLQNLVLRDESVGSQGATATIAVIVGETVYIANAGDSIALLKNSADSLHVAPRHSLENPAERLRLASIESIYVGEYLATGITWVDKSSGVDKGYSEDTRPIVELSDGTCLMVEPTKGFGDAEFAKLDPERAIPEITLYTNINRCVLASDGIDKKETHSVFKTSMTDGELIEEFKTILLRKEDVDSITARIKNLSLFNGSWDDITVVHAECRPEQFSLLGVFDGHGGNTVSYGLKEIFPKVFQRELHAVLEAQRTAESKEEPPRYPVGEAWQDKPSPATEIAQPKGAPSPGTTPSP